MRAYINTKYVLTLFLVLSLLKLSYAQNWEWAHSLYSDVDLTFTNDICVDHEANVYITGEYAGGIFSVNGTQLPSVASDRGYVVKLDKNGNVIFMKNFIGAEGKIIVVDDEQSVYLFGSSVPGGYVFFANAGHWYDHFLAKYDSVGNELWIKDMSDLWLQSMDLSPSGNIGIAGGFSSTTFLDSMQIISQGCGDILVAELNSHGDFIWANTYGNQYCDEVSNLTYDQYSNIYIGGRFADTLLLDSFMLPSQSIYNSFIARIDSGGSGVSACKSFPYAFWITGLEVNQNQEVIALLAGGNVDTFYIDGTPVPNPTGAIGAPNILCNISLQGTVNWATLIDAYQSIFRTDMTLNHLDEILMLGSLWGSSSSNGYPNEIFVNNTTVFSGSNNPYSDYPFLLKFDHNGQLLLGEHIEASGGQQETFGVCIDPYDDIYITGFYGADTLSFASDTTLLRPGYFNSSFVAKYNDCSFQNLYLEQGWSMVSSYVSPTDTLMDELFSSVDSSVQLLKSGNGDIYWHQFGVNNIGNWVINEGYQLKMAEARDFKICGDYILPELTPITINSGWQIIAYLRKQLYPIDSVLSTFSLNIDIVKNGQGQVYWPAWNVDLIQDMNPGEGYQLKANAPFNFTYPAND